MRNVIIGLIVLALIGTGAYFFLGGQPPAEEEAAEEETAVEILPPVSASERVIAEAEVVPVRDVQLRFERSGTISEILVSEGDDVGEGDVLARLDDRDLVLLVEQRRAELAVTRASYELLLAGATTDELAAAEARLENARALRDQRAADVARAQADVARAQGDLLSRQGDVTASDIAAAQAELEEARASLADLESGSDQVDIDTARASVAQSQANLESERNRLSAAKTQAESTLELRANELRNAQAEYSQVYWEVREVERDLNDVDQQLWQQQKDREEAALRRVQDAEQRLAQAQTDVDAARQAEITGIQSAEAQLADAQARLDDVLAGAEPDELAAARARVARAQANLDKLQGAQRAGQLAAAAASVSAAQAGVDTSAALVNAAAADIERSEAELEDLKAPPREPEIDDREARILQSEVALQQAELDLDKASLYAPLTGTVVEVDMEAGERVDTTQVVVRLADFSEWLIETTDLTELGIVRVQVGDPVEITFDAIPDLTLPGVVDEIQDIGKDRQGDIVYKVTVRPTDWDPRLRWRMTAQVSIEPSDVGSEASEPTALPAPTEAAEE